MKSLACDKCAVWQIVIKMKLLFQTQSRKLEIMLPYKQDRMALLWDC